MCKADEKLRIFSYALYKLLAIHKEKGDLMSKDDKEVLKTFSNIRIMKLLYCLCLESLDPNNSSKDIGLFKYFGHFYAYPYGPVLPDVFYSFYIVPGFVYENGHFVDTKNELPKDEINEDWKTIIDKAADNLKSNMDFALFNNRDKLVELTHQLPIWIETRFFKSNREMSDDFCDLKQEYEKYKSLLNENSLN